MIETCGTILPRVLVPVKTFSVYCGFQTVLILPTSTVHGRLASCNHCGCIRDIDTPPVHSISLTMLWVMHLGPSEHHLGIGDLEPTGAALLAAESSTG